MSRKVYTKYKFALTAHRGVKVGEKGMKKTLWDATITLETSELVDNEVEAERDLEALLSNSFLPFFGVAPPRLMGIFFRWDSREIPKTIGDGEEFYETIEVCHVEINYLTSIRHVTHEESRDRLLAMGYGFELEKRGL